MTKLEVFETMDRIRVIDEQLQVIAIKIERLESCAQGHAIRYDQIKVQSSVVDPVERIIEDLSKLIDRQKVLRGQMVKAIDDASELIELVDDRRQKLVLYYRYVGLLAWGEVADRVHTSERHVYRLHDLGIDTIKRQKCQ